MPLSRLVPLLVGSLFLAIVGWVLLGSLDSPPGAIERPTFLLDAVSPPNSAVAPSNTRSPDVTSRVAQDDPGEAADDEVARDERAEQLLRPFERYAALRARESAALNGTGSLLETWEVAEFHALELDVDPRAIKLPYEGPELTGVLLTAAGEPVPAADLWVGQFHEDAWKILADGTPAGLIAALRRATPAEISRSLTLLTSVGAEQRPTFGEPRLGQAMSNPRGGFAIPLPRSELTSPLVLLVMHPDHVTLVSDPFLEIPTAPLELRYPETGLLVIRYELSDAFKAGRIVTESPLGSLAPHTFAGALTSCGLRLRYPLSRSLPAWDYGARERFELSPEVDQPDGEIEHVPAFNVPAIGDYTIHVDDPDAALSTEHVHVRVGERVEHQIVVESAPAIRGRVVDAEGSPIEGMYVAVTPRDTFGWDRTDAEGRFRIRSARRSPQPVQLHHPGSHVPWGEAVMGEPGGAHLELRYAPEPGGRLRIDFQAPPPERARWFINLAGKAGAWDLSLPGDPNDEVPIPAQPSFAGIPPGDYVLHGSLEFTEGPALVIPHTPVQIRPGRLTQASVPLSLGATLALRVLDAATNEPLTGAEALTAAPDFTRGESNRAGRLVLDGLAPNVDTVFVKADGYAVQRAMFEADQTDPVEVRLDAGVTVEGLLQDAHGLPVPDMELNFYGDFDQRVTRTDANGRYRCRMLSVNAPYSVSLRDRALETSLGPIQTSAAATQTIDLTLPAD